MPAERWFTEAREAALRPLSAPKPTRIPVSQTLRPGRRKMSPLQAGLLTTGAALLVLVALAPEVLARSSYERDWDVFLNLADDWESERVELPAQRERNHALRREMGRRYRHQRPTRSMEAVSPSHPGQAPPPDSAGPRPAGGSRGENRLAEEQRRLQEELLRDQGGVQPPSSQRQGSPESNQQQHHHYQQGSAPSPNPREEAARRRRSRQEERRRRAEREELQRQEAQQAQQEALERERRAAKQQAREAEKARRERRRRLLGEGGGDDAQELDADVQQLLQGL